MPSYLLHRSTCAVFIGGIGYAFYIKSNDRAKYEIIGRLINEGLDQV